MPAPNIISDVNDFINSLPAYDQSEQTIQLLDLVREIQSSNNYYWVGACFPQGDLVTDLTIGAGKTVNGAIVIPAGTYITAISATYDPNQSVNTGLGFKFRLYDKGSKGDIVYGSYIKDTLITSQGELQSNIASADEQMPFPVPGSAFLQGPFIVTAPGQLNWEITNLDVNNAVIIQLMLDCAVPISQKNFGNLPVAKVTG